MATGSRVHNLTVDDYLALDDGRRYELWDGELVEMVPSPTFDHQGILGNLFHALYEYTQSGKKGAVRFAPLDVILSKRYVLQPDLIYISEKRKKIIKTRIHGAPDMVAEILSPSTTKHDAVKKRRLYARFGIQEYWLVDPEEQTVEVLTLEGKFYVTVAVFEPGQAVKSPMFPGLKLTVKDVFKS